MQQVLTKLEVLWLVSIFPFLNWTGSKKPVPECIVSVESMNIFPVGWCETNGYQLRPPRKAIGTSSLLFAEVGWSWWDLPEQITAELLLALLSLETFIMHRESVCCTTVPLAVGASWKPYSFKPHSVGLRPLHSVGTIHWPSKEILPVYEDPPCSAFTSVSAVLAMCLTLILILHVHLCKVKLMPQQSSVDCVHIWSQNKGNWFSQWARWWWSLMTKCWRVNPTF